MGHPRAELEYERATSGPPRPLQFLVFSVLGSPAPKGSGRGMMIGGKARYVASSSRKNEVDLVSWSAAVQNAARLALSSAQFFGVVPFVGVPLRMKAIFRMKRPKGHLVKKGEFVGHVRGDAPKYVTSKPDSSKLLRSTEDDLTGLVYDDDSRIVEHFIRKVYAAPGAEGAWIRIERIEGA